MVAPKRARRVCMVRVETSVLYIDANLAQP